MILKWTCSMLVIMVFTVFADDSNQNYRVVSEDFESGHATGFKPHDPTGWEVISEDGNRVYCLKNPGKQVGTIRKPGAYSIMKNELFSTFTLTARVKCLRPADVRGRDIIVVFGYQDDTHFYYAHLSNVSDQVHNRILLVNGADREPIGSEITIPKLKEVEYYKLRIRRNAELGSIEVYLNDMEWPVMSAVDKTFGSGKIGFGTFDDTACFDDIRIVGIE